MTRLHDSIIVNKIARIIVPLIQLYAFYVLLHGHITPGGGFQGGILFAGSIILSILSYGIDTDLRFPKDKAILIGALGVIIYTLVGVVTVVFNGNFLDYSKLNIVLDVAKRRYFGILFVETGVFIGVAGTILAIFFELAPDSGNQPQKLH